MKKFAGDRELLEGAAKAAGLQVQKNVECVDADDKFIGIKVRRNGNDRYTRWNPLTDDGDALRLAVKLRLVVHVWDDESHVSAAKTLPDGEDPSAVSDAWEGSPVNHGDTYAATRRAIVRTAYAIAGEAAS